MVHLKSLLLFFVFVILNRSWRISKEWFATCLLNTCINVIACAVLIVWFESLDISTVGIDFSCFSIWVLEHIPSHRGIEPGRQIIRWFFKTSRMVCEINLHFLDYSLCIEPISLAVLSVKSFDAFAGLDRRDWKLTVSFIEAISAVIELNAFLRTPRTASVSCIQCSRFIFTSLTQCFGHLIELTWMPWMFNRCPRSVLPQNLKLIWLHPCAIVVLQHLLFRSSLHPIEVLARMLQLRLSLCTFHFFVALHSLGLLLYLTSLLHGKKQFHRVHTSWGQFWLSWH